MDADAVSAAGAAPVVAGKVDDLDPARQAPFLPSACKAQAYTRAVEANDRPGARETLTRCDAANGRQLRPRDARLVRLYLRNVGDFHRIAARVAGSDVDRNELLLIPIDVLPISRASRSEVDQVSLIVGEGVHHPDLLILRP